MLNFSIVQCGFYILREMEVVFIVFETHIHIQIVLLFIFLYFSLFSLTHHLFWYSDSVMVMVIAINITLT